MPTPVTPPSNPSWLPDVSPSGVFNTLDSTVSNIKGEITSIQGKVTGGVQTASQALLKGQGWFNQVKQGASNAGINLNNIVGSVGAFASQTSGVVAKLGTTTSVQNQIADLINKAVNITTGFLNVITNSAVPGDVASQLTTASTNFNNTLNSIQSAVSTLLDGTPDTPDFISKVEAGIRSNITILNSATLQLTNLLKTLAPSIDGLIGGAAALTGAKLAADLITDPSKLLNNVTEYLSKSKIKMITLQPEYITNIEELQEPLTKAVSQELAGSPDGSGFNGALILIAHTQGISNSLSLWINNLITLYGNVQGVGTTVINTINSPLLSPLAKLFDTTENKQESDEKLLDFDIPPFPVVMQRMSTGTVEVIKEQVGADSLVSKLVEPGSLLGNFFSYQPSDEQKDRQDVTALKDAANTLVPLEPLPMPSLGLKEVTDKASSLVTNASKIVTDIQGNWAEVNKPEDIFRAVGAQITTMSGILTDVTGLSSQLTSLVDSVIKQAKVISAQTGAIAEQSTEAAKGSLDVAIDEIKNLKYDTVLIPPAAGGLNKLRDSIRSLIRNGAEGVTPVNGDTSMFVTMLVVQAPTLIIGNFVFEQILKQFQKN